MNTRKKVKKASDVQKEFLLSFMEQSIDFANDRFSPEEGRHSKVVKWRLLSHELNKIRGARKDVNQWRKYWRDQKLHAKEREALMNAPFHNSKPLNPSEKRILALFPSTDAELQVLSQEEAVYQPLPPPEDDNELLEPKLEIDSPEPASPEPNRAPSSEKEIDGISFVEEKPTVVSPVTLPEVETSSQIRRKKIVPSWKQSKLSFFERKMLKLKEEKLFYIKKCYDVQKESLSWKKEYEQRLLELREREVSVLERELQLRIKNNM